MYFLNKRIVFLYVFLFSLTPIATNAQQTALKIPDSLKNKTLGELGNLFNFSDTTRIEAYEKMIIHFDKNDSATTKLYVGLGWLFFNKENFTKSIDYLKIAAKMAKRQKNIRLQNYAYTGIGHVRLLEGNYPEALDAYFIALDFSKKMQDIDSEIASIGGIVTVLKRIGKLEKAHELSQRMLYLIEKSPYKNKRNHARVLATTNEVYLALEKYDSVLYFADKGIEISKNIDHKKTLVHLYIEKGMVYYHKKNYNEALDYLLKSKELLENNEINWDSFPTALTNYFLAGCYYETNNYDLAIDRLLKITSTAKGNDFFKTSIIQPHLLLANCYGKKEDFKTAMFWHDKYTKLMESYQKEKDETANKIFERDAEKLQAQIGDLKNKQAESEKAKAYSLAGSALLLVVLLVGGYRYRQKQKSNAHLFDNLINQINQLEHQKQEDIQKPVKAIAIDQTKIHQILQQLHGLEEQEYFLRKDCSLSNMAKKVKTNSSYLSKVINQHKEKNFSNYINDLRIDYVTNRLKRDSIFRKYTIDAIAQEIGFANAKSFSSVFYKKTGIYPSYFIKQLNKKSMVS